MIKRYLFGIVCILVLFIACSNEPTEKIHLNLEDCFSGLIQIVIHKDGIRPARSKPTLVLDIPSSGVLYLKSWPTTFQLSGSQSGVWIPTEHSGNTGALSDDQKGLRNMGTTTLGDGTIINWFFLGSESEKEKTRIKLNRIAPRYLEYNSAYSDRPTGSNNK